MMAQHTVGDLSVLALLGRWVPQFHTISSLCGLMFSAWLLLPSTPVVPPTICRAYLCELTQKGRMVGLYKLIKVAYMAFCRLWNKKYINQIQLQVAL